jgi:hypothetical protein
MTELDMALMRRYEETAIILGRWTGGGDGGGGEGGVGEVCCARVRTPTHEHESGDQAICGPPVVLMCIACVVLCVVQARRRPLCALCSSQPMPRADLQRAHL